MRSPEGPRNLRKNFWRGLYIVTMRYKNLIRIALATAFLLLVPLVAMQFTDEVVWTLFDFIFAGTLLFGTGLAYELVARKANTFAYRAAVGVALAAALLLIWINGAVGIIGSENNPANLLYGGVLAVVLIGTILARLKPRLMARTVFATALAQSLVPVIALIIWTPLVTAGEGPGIFGVFVLNSFFVLMWVVSALLFRDAALHPQELSRKAAS